MSVLWMLGSAVACGPAVVVPDDDADSTTSGAASTSGLDSAAMEVSGPPPVTGSPPNPTEPATTSPVTTGSPPAPCVDGEWQNCSCPDGGLGWQECDRNGVFGPCDCSVEGSSSSGGSDLPDVPDPRPGETCLSVGDPCEGDFNLHSDDDVEYIAACSVVIGSVVAYEGVTTLEPLGCLREVSGGLQLESASVESLAGLEALELVDEITTFSSPQLTSFGAPSLELVRSIYIVDNPQLAVLDFPNLAVITQEWLVIENPSLPNCQVQAIYEQTMSEDLLCSDNLADACIDVCF